MWAWVLWALLRFSMVGSQTTVDPYLYVFPVDTTRPTTWSQLKSTTGVKFSARHAHASCLYTPPCEFQGSSCDRNPRLWVVGGKTEQYQMYNTLYSVKQNDVWYSVSSTEAVLGQNWVQIVSMTGDYYEQNADAIQPGPIAPFYQRFGHTLTAYSSSGLGGSPDMMILMGGFAPNPMNDIWVTQDGSHWMYHKAPWSPRGWHSVVVHQGVLYIMGGSPLNNEVWRMDDIKMVNRTRAPLTRATWSKQTFKSNWTRLTSSAEWSPRAGMQIVSQWYYNATAGEDSSNAVARLVLIGGYGGQLLGTPDYNGYVTRGDVWTSSNGTNWVMLAPDPNPNLPGRAWFSARVMVRGGGTSLENSKLDASGAASMMDEAPPRIYIFGGGYVGGLTSTTSSQIGLLGRTDGRWSRDGITWTQINFEEGGYNGQGIRGSYDTYVKYFSSELWTKVSIDGQFQYLGLWGHTIESYNNTMIMIAGDMTGAGPITNNVFQSVGGIFCDQLGVICSGHGACGPANYGCVCMDGYQGEFCDDDCGANCKTAENTP